MKKKLIEYTCIGFGILSVCYILNKNRKQNGIIKNQQLTINGLMKDVKNLSYHLGKNTILTKK